jgi:hypothetical protein
MWSVTACSAKVLGLIMHPHDIPWQSNASQQFAHPCRCLDHISQGVRFRARNKTAVAHLGQDLRDHIVATLDLAGEQWRAQELFQGVGYTVQELQD